MDSEHNVTRRAPIAGVVLLAILAAACSSSAKSATPTTPAAALPPTSTTVSLPAPAGLPAFYSVPQPIAEHARRADQVGERSRRRACTARSTA